MSFGSVSFGELTCMHGVYLVNTQGFVWKFFLCAIYKCSFVHSFIHSCHMSYQGNFMMMASLHLSFGSRHL